MALAQAISTGCCKKSHALTKEQEFLLKVKSGEIKTKKQSTRFGKFKNGIRFE